MSARRTGSSIVLCVVSALVIGCGPKAVTVSPAQVIAGGVTKQEIQLDSKHRLWVYKPAKMKGNCPLVLIAPAGSPMCYGMSLGEGDVPEHVPYAKAGCIVVAYDLSGPYTKGQGSMNAAVKSFIEAEVGIDDAKRALDYALKSIPEADPKRVIAVGHSSAATISLQVAQADPRITACVAYAPVIDVVGRFEAKFSEFDRVVPEFSEVIKRTSPSSHMGQKYPPLFLFHANDDSVVDGEPIRKFAKSISGATLVEVPSGDHYDSMINEGIPAALKWLKTRGFVGS